MKRLLLVALVVTCLGVAGRAAAAPPQKGAAAPAFTLTDQSGKKVALADQRGKKVVLVFYRGYW